MWFVIFLLSPPLLQNRKEPESASSGQHRGVGGIEAQHYGSDHHAVAQGGEATARSSKSRSRPRKPAVYIEGLPVYIPEAAMNPMATGRYPPHPSPQCACVC